ncbi:Gfo/Idh/MocA family oxidoreductase [Plantactinospora mayteni]|uniref:Oxidoreductase n=1 Tax=Plantactinospora mayteni TaxID=566021 RepID=A0ABQ4EFN6_9ACTN|nr:Gfo/Idh/MocA family oxidoreductase [Plantactinospora mayteni]GIG93509.1 oxidoreductase [Plantactinospora mayteni]
MSPDPAASHLPPARVRVALVGCGAVVQHGHVPAYAASPALDVVAVCDPAAERRSTVGRLLGVPPHRWLDRASDLTVLADRPQVVVVATPTATHDAVIDDLLGNGFHVVSEKPISPTVDGCLALVRRATGHGRRLGVLHNYQFATMWQATAAELAAGAVGDPLAFDVRLTDPGPLPGLMPQQPMWRTSRSLAGGGCLLDAGYHFVYLAEELMASPVTEVTADAIETVTPGWSVEDRARVRLRHAGGAVTSLCVDWTVRTRQRPYLRVTGSRGHIEVDEDAAMVTVHRHGDAERVIDCTDDPHGFRTALPGAVLGTVGDADHRGSAERGRRVVSIVEACYASAAEGKTVHLDRPEL